MEPLPYEKSGNPKSNQMLVFLHGWPDTTQLWDNISPNFEKDYYIISISYPNFSEKEQKKWGEDFPDMARRIKATLDFENKAKRRITLVAHDWGAIYAYTFDQLFPKYISDLIALDVSPWVKPNLLVVIYQFILVVAFLIGGKIGEFLSKSTAKFFKYKPSYYNRINGSWGYPYYYFWRNLIKSKFTSKSKRIPGFGRYFPSCPVAYVYGKKKPCQFHTQRWLDKVAEDPKNFVQGLNTGHWITKEQPSFVIDLIKKRLVETGKGV